MRGHLLVDVPLIAAAVSLYPTCGLAPVGWLAAASAIIHGWAVVSPRSSLYMPVWWRVPGSRDCALTYDDGPNPEVTPRLLDLLAGSDQRATFFVIGSHVRRHPHLVRRMVAEGHAVGLHSDTHSRWFNCWLPGRIQRDLDACGKAIADAAGIPSPRLFRPPVGLKNPMVGFVCGRMGLRAITWTARARDTGSPAVEVVLARIAGALRPGGICVMHDGHEPGRDGVRASCLESTPLAIARLTSLGLRSGPLRATADGVAIGGSDASAEMVQPLAR
ncbi:MAG: polysaccharide deacetylase family protein [Planctomycetes bacterium]|nr:polysaccharide deacetylase family protein [Planctomycetota bacterium]